jgi:hypothetical protein
MESALALSITLAKVPLKASKKGTAQAPAKSPAKVLTKALPLVVKCKIESDMLLFNKIISLSLHQSCHIKWLLFHYLIKIVDDG